MSILQEAAHGPTCTIRDTLWHLSRLAHFGLQWTKMSLPRTTTASWGGDALVQADISPSSANLEELQFFGKQIEWHWINMKTLINWLYNLLPA